MYLSAIEQIGVFNTLPIVRPETQNVNSSKKDFLGSRKK